MAGRGRRELRDLADAVRLRPLEEVAPFLGYVRDPTDQSRWPQDACIPLHAFPCSFGSSIRLRSWHTGCSLETDPLHPNLRYCQPVRTFGLVSVETVKQSGSIRFASRHPVTESVPQVTWYRAQRILCNTPRLRHKRVILDSRHANCSSGLPHSSRRACSASFDRRMAFPKFLRQVNRYPWVSKRTLSLGAGFCGAWSCMVGRRQNQ